MWVLLTMMALTQRGELLAQQYTAATRQQNRAENSKTVDKNLDFVNKMREDLRRNNDDYALLEGQNQLEQPPLTAHPAPRQPNRKRSSPAHGMVSSERASLPYNSYDARRGEGDMNQDVVIQGHMDQGAMNQGDVNQEAKFQGNMTQSNQSPTEFRTFTHAKQMKSLRVSKLKKLLHRDKDKVRMRDTKPNEPEDKKSSTLLTTILTRPLTPVLTSLPSPPRRTRTPRPPAFLRNGHLREDMKRQGPPYQNMKRQSPLHEDMERQSPLHEDMERQSPFHEDMERQSPPREDIERQIPPRENMERQRPPRRPERNPMPLPEQIDMAHARNPLITRIRLKGRLCQRSLMNIEGPTYDHEGKQVVPEHDPRKVRGRLFHQTRAPELVLPKCCNCCKKSVLGCQ